MVYLESPDAVVIVPLGLDILVQNNMFMRSIRPRGHDIVDCNWSIGRYEAPTVLHILLGSQCLSIVVVLALAKRRVYIIFLNSSSDFSIYLILELLDIYKDANYSGKGLKIKRGIRSCD